MIGSGEWFCSRYCRRMARRQRPKRNEEDDREWSFSDAEFIELEKRIVAYGKSVGAKTVRHLVKDGKPVVQEGAGDGAKVEGPPGGKGSDTG